MVQAMVADSEIDIAAAAAADPAGRRRCSTRGASAAQSSRRSPRPSSPRRSDRVVDRSVQICGALGISDDVLLSRYLPRGAAVPDLRRPVRDAPLGDRPAGHRPPTARDRGAATSRRFAGRERQRYDPTSVDDSLFASVDPPRLAGSKCGNCGTVTFPVPGQLCELHWVRHDAVELPDRGTLWTWTVQAFEPKAPYRVPASGFTPYGVGYVDLGEVIVESRLAGDPSALEIGRPMRLVLLPVWPAAVAATS